MVLSFENWQVILGYKKAENFAEIWTQYSISKSDLSEPYTYDLDILRFEWCEWNVIKCIQSYFVLAVWIIFIQRQLKVFFFFLSNGSVIFLKIQFHTPYMLFNKDKYRWTLNEFFKA